MKTAILQHALALGFDACRITRPDPPDHLHHFQRWLARGHHGTMAYLERQTLRRSDPREILPNARSLLCLAASYAGPEPTPPTTLTRPSPPQGVIARYARSRDYHDVLGQPLQSLTARLADLGGPTTRSIAYVDTGPILERDLAQRAGLGFIGKHTNLIAPPLGNWLLLAEILTTLDLEPDPPEPNRCGTCTRCLSACPTQAIVAPFDLDARRCISYLTIELKGPIPVEFRPSLGQRIFGCDDCLAVCPWNRFARMGRLMADHARPDLDAPALLDLLALDNAGFRARFRDTPLIRAKRRGLLRNVCVALGNLGDPEALPALHRAARDPEPLIAEHAQWAIEAIKSHLDRKTSEGNAASASRPSPQAGS